MKINIEKILKQIINPANLLIAVLLIIVIIIVVRKTENFSKSPRYMYMYNPTSKNSSYDIRGEVKYIPKEMDKVGAFYDSSYNFNYTNQRLPVE